MTGGQSRTADQRREADRIRKQEERARYDAGIILLPVALNKQHITRLLVNLKKIDPDISNDRKALSEAVSELLASLKAVDIVPE
ncbi:hypothetical protein [Mesorhizobium kowhaii]|uniref:Uncharacterized protein n=1 Tax=Mesorhizobium kowhaii TaxID=1300272 RepID=A0A2W7BZZ4_9HYPH|nr:hypothetical protein [Mesorhizobium kowhaii]PZV36164.1 hypothetical protein B5V02_23445 [Mesorhizobium kowhaii]